MKRRNFLTRLLALPAVFLGGAVAAQALPIPGECKLDSRGEPLCLKDSPRSYLPRLDPHTLNNVAAWRTGISPGGRAGGWR